MSDEHVHYRSKSASNGFSNVLDTQEAHTVFTSLYTTSHAKQKKNVWFYYCSILQAFFETNRGKEDPAHEKKNLHTCRV